MAVLGNCLVCRAEDKGRTNTIATHAEDQVASKVATVAVDVMGQAGKKYVAAIVMVRASILAADAVDPDPNSGQRKQGEE